MRKYSKRNGFAPILLISVVVVLFIQLWRPLLMFMVCFVPLYFWERKQSHKRMELHRQQLKEQYGVQDVSVAIIIDIINQLLIFQKQKLTPSEKKRKKRLIEELDMLICESSVKGYVYFLKEYGNQTVKIGKTNNPYDRILKAFGVKFPNRIELLYLLRSNEPLVTERLFHQQFKSKHVDGEWFMLEPEDMEWIRAADYPISIYKSMQGILDNRKI